MRIRRVTIESLENRQLLNAGPVDESASSDAGLLSSSIVQRGLVRFQNDGTLILNGESETTQLAQHWPSLENKSNWTPLLTGDFNNDGIDDVFAQSAADDNDNSWLHLNDGEQFFLVPWGESLPAHTEIIDAGDVNNDGLLDVISINRSTNEIWVSVNGLQNGFRNELWARWPNSLHTQILVGDFDQDGNTDLLAGETGGTWSLARSTGDRFEIQAWGPYGVFDWQDVVTGDFNGDRFPDVAARAPDRTWWVWQGSDSSLAPAQYAGHWKMATNWADVHVADFNADGRDDLIGRDVENGFLWVASSVPPLDGMKTEFHTWRWVTGWVSGADWRNISISDVTADGLPDQIGQARDGTWWVAENIGNNFRNSFLDRPTSTTDYVATMNHTVNERSDAVLDHLPSANTLTSAAESYEPLRISLNQNNELVVTGSGQQLRAIEFQSASGSLLPLRQIGANTGFNQLSQNEPIKIRLSTSSAVTIDGSLVLGVKWDETSKARDLVVNYDVVEVSASVDDQLFLPKSSVADLTLSNAEKYAQLFLDSVRVVPQEPEFVASEVTPEPSSDEEPGSNHEAETDVEGDADNEADSVRDTDVPIDESVNEKVDEEPAENTEPSGLAEADSTESKVDSQTTNDVSVSFDEHQQFVVAPTSALVYALRIESPTQSLIPTEIPSPFDEILVADSGLVVLAANEPVAFDETTPLRVGWEKDRPTDQLIVEFANDQSEWLPAHLFGERTSTSNTTGYPDFGATEPGAVQIELNAEDDFVVTATNLSVLGLNFISSDGGLVPGSSPRPFELFVSNTAKQVTLGTFGTPVQLDGSLTLDIGWDSQFPLSGLVVEFGDLTAGVHSAEIIDSSTLVPRPSRNTA